MGLEQIEQNEEITRARWLVVVPPDYQRLHGRPQPRRGCPPLLSPRPRSAGNPRPLASPLPWYWPRPLGGFHVWNECELLAILAAR